MKNRKMYILGVIDDLVYNFIYYDRKEDEELTIEDMVNRFRQSLKTIL